MYEMLKNITGRPRLYEFYTAETLWNDRHISKQMLEIHLSNDTELASRNAAFIDRSVTWMTSRFNIGRNTKICDFGCGPGLYTSRFAEKGASVTGVDFSERSIRYARESAAEKNLYIDYINMNYLDFRTDVKFDLITMIYCDFCALSPDQRKKLLAGFHDCLDENGSIFLDVCSLHAFGQREETSGFGHMLMDGFWSPDDYYGFMNTFVYEDEKVVLDKYTIIEASRKWEVYNWLQYFSRKSISEEFENSGFRVETYYSDVAGTPWREDAPEIAVTVKKI